LKWSKGSRQDRQRHIDLQEVDPNRVTSSVSDEPHCGQPTRGPELHQHRPVHPSGRGDAVLLELAPTVLGHPVRRPGRRQHRAHLDVVPAVGGERRPDVRADLVHRRAAGVRRRHRHHDPAAVHRDLPQDAEVGDGEDRDLRVGDLVEHRAHPLDGDGRDGGHHDAPGCDRCTCCSSASR
jgi:hypothetical protein